MNRLDGRNLEYRIMGKIGIPSADFLSGHPRAYQEKLAAIDKLRKVIDDMREEGHGIAASNESLIAQARAIASDETGLETRTTFEVVSYVVQAHIDASNEAQSEGGRSEEEVLSEMSDFLRKHYHSREGGGEVKLH